MKYIIVKSATTPEVSIIFSSLLHHINMIPHGMEIVAAGFVKIRGCGYDCGNKGKPSTMVECFGESVTCSLKNRGHKDAQIIMRDMHWPDE